MSNSPLLPLLEKLVSFRSVDGQPEEKKKLVAFVESWLREKKLPVERIEVENEAPALSTSLPGNGAGKPILFLAHLDVVPAEEKMFKIERDGDTLRGRGVIDDKGPVAALLLLFEKLAAVPENFPPAQLLLSADEEIGSPLFGRIAAARFPKENFRAVVVLDSGEEDEIITKQKGLIHLALEATGKSSHGAIPWEGENAIDKLLAAVEKIRALFAGENFEDPDHWHSTVSLNKIAGGEFVNKVPDSAEALLDIRFTERWKEGALMEEIKKAVAGLAEIPAARKSSGEMFASSPDEPLLKKYREVVGNALGVEIKNGLGHGATDARFFGGGATPVWMHYPRGGKLHTPEEWASLSSLEKMPAALAEFLREAA